VESHTANQFARGSTSVKKINLKRKQIAPKWDSMPQQFFLFFVFNKNFLHIYYKIKENVNLFKSMNDRNLNQEITSTENLNDKQHWRLENL